MQKDNASTKAGCIFAPNQRSDRKWPVLWAKLLRISFAPMTSPAFHQPILSISSHPSHPCSACLTLTWEPFAMDSSLDRSPFCVTAVMTCNDHVCSSILPKAFTALGSPQIRLEYLGICLFVPCVTLPNPNPQNNKQIKHQNHQIKLLQLPA